MAGGRKKRPKKKQKNQSQNASNVSSSSTLSNDVVKHQTDEDSNVGEVSSLASQNRDLLDISSKGNEETGSNEESVVQTDGGVEIKDVYNEKDGKIEQGEMSTSNNSAGSSDDESRGITTNPSLEDCSAAVNPVEIADLLSETPKVDEITLSVEKTEVGSSSVGSSDPKDCEVQQKEDISTTSYGTSNVPVNNGAEGGKDSVTQPLLERNSQKTSWKSCCGLFELFKGSAS